MLVEPWLAGLLSMVAVIGTAARTNAAPPSVIAFGDSTCVGTGARAGGYVDDIHHRVQEIRPGTRLESYCRNGATVADVLHDQLTRWRGKGGVVLVGVGANDVTAGIGAETFASRFEELVREIGARQPEVFVISNIPDASLAPAVPPSFKATVNQRIRQFNAVIAQVAARGGAVVFDTFALSQQLLPRHREFFSGDGYHPSDAGYRAWADHLWPLVASALR